MLIGFIILEMDPVLVETIGETNMFLNNNACLLSERTFKKVRKTIVYGFVYVLVRWECFETSSGLYQRGSTAIPLEKKFSWITKLRKRLRANWTIDTNFWSCQINYFFMKDGSSSIMQYGTSLLMESSII